MKKAREKTAIEAKRIDIEWNPDLSIYASESFLNAVGDEYGWIGGVDDSGKTRCLLPYTIVQKLFLRMVRFRVETIPLVEEFGVHEEKQFLNSAIEYFRSIKADMIIPATTNTIFRTFPNGAIAAPYGTYIIDLIQAEETIWGNFSASHRRKVRLAIKKRVEIRSGVEFTSVAYQLVRDTFRRSRLGFMDYEAFARFVHRLDKSVKILVAFYNGAIQGCVVIPFSNHSAYYVYGGSIPDPVAGATNMLHWEAIKQFRQIGVRHYDFVGVRINPEIGSKQAGLKMFKERFGGKLFQGYMWKYSLNPVKFTCYALASRFLRGGDIVDCERHKMGKPDFSKT